MSKSVTVIGGKVWTQHSVTWNRNVSSGTVDEGSEVENDHCGEGPDHDHDRAAKREWDTVHEGRNFTRRVKTT